MRTLQNTQLTDPVWAWADDPGHPKAKRTPMLCPRPDMAAGPMPVGIRGAVPSPEGDQPGSLEFRYWNLAAALRRAADYWGPLMPLGLAWRPEVGLALHATMDHGDDLNAYYDRTGLVFFHHAISGMVVYSAESPDVVCHEVGHAVLDSLQPGLWSVASAEGAAFHESFGDMSAILCALQLESVRAEVIAETLGDLSRTSTLSRIAEQLGWAIREINPAAVDPDCLRNAANSFFYVDPVTLPSRGPASRLCSEPHSFSRVFTGAFLRALAGMWRQQGTTDTASLAAVSVDMGRLLVAAVAAAPLVPGYFAQVAAHMLAADSQLYQGRYGRRLRTAFVRYGILAPTAATSLTADTLQRKSAGIVGAVPLEQPGLAMVTIPGEAYGLTHSFAVAAPTAASRFSVAGAALDVGAVTPSGAGLVAESFVEDLFRRGRVAVPENLRADTDLSGDDEALYTHEIMEDGAGPTLTRRLFD
ncbi:hypothetical protein GCM10010124_33310 [Pilimelia terevasa]|uniref:Uncharacterized protein n=1 Tax=Pilimelia terevasa TaxID=53372 RepID=A0A8J3FJJ6_9ACTN|nr:hypothetical protein [Pilimelia terevasa]GGK37855.1 hypothetical protein GCM10010124_33310 [Pilimelia terevasa]